MDPKLGFLGCGKNIFKVDFKNVYSNKMAGKNNKVVGIDFYKNKWRARLNVDGKRIEIGYFDKKMKLLKHYLMHKVVTIFLIFLRVTFAIPFLIHFTLTKILKMS